MAKITHYSIFSDHVRFMAGSVPTSGPLCPASNLAPGGLEALLINSREMKAKELHVRMPMNYELGAEP
jgi:hypothetical protein